MSKFFVQHAFPVVSLCTLTAAHAAPTQVSVQSPDARNCIVLNLGGKDHGQLRYTISRDGKLVIGPSPIGPVLSKSGAIGSDVRIANAKKDQIDETFDLPWGKTVTVENRCARAIVNLISASDVHWRVELRAYNDGVAFRYCLLQQPGAGPFELIDEETQFDVAGGASALFDTLPSFTTSHEALYEHKPLAELPVKKLMDMPVLLTWPHGQAAAITEARVRHFAGAYLERISICPGDGASPIFAPRTPQKLGQPPASWDRLSERPTADSTTLRCRLAPLPKNKKLCVIGKAPLESPWRVVLLADVAGKLLESNILLCLNDPPQGDFSWLRPGKTTFHWWYGEFEDDYKSSSESDVYFRRHCKYIDFCAKNNIAYHAISGDGYAWYVQSKADYGSYMPDADVRRPRPELEIPKIIAYAHKRGVGIRLWVHWKALSKHLEGAFSLYESWGVQGLMVDFLDRDDQEMVEWTERMLDCAAQHKLNIQIHGSSKYSGEERTFPNLFNREGVLGLEYAKWSDLCTPAHSVNVAYTRAIAGPVDFHLGGFRSVSRTAFRPRYRAPVVTGTRCHNLALYIVYENPMPMVADAPSAYEGQVGFDFIREVPTTWDETRFVVGEPGEFVVIARRKKNTWYLGGITNWTPRALDVPLTFLGHGEFKAALYVDGSMDESQPNAIARQQQNVGATTPLHISLAPGGGFVGTIHAKRADEHTEARRGTG